MDGWRRTYEFTRAALALVGALVCSLALLVTIVAFGVSFIEPEPAAAPAPAPAPTISFATADSLLNEAGIDRATQSLELVAQNPGEWFEKDRSNIELYCLKAPKLQLAPSWLEPNQLQSMMVLASKATFDAAHAANDCVPTWTDAVWKGMRVQPMQLSWSQRQLGFARLALYDRDTQMLYLVSRTTPTSPPVSPTVASAPSPSTD